MSSRRPPEDCTASAAIAISPRPRASTWVSPARFMMTLPAACVDQVADHRAQRSDLGAVDDPRSDGQSGRALSLHPRSGEKCPCSRSMTLASAIRRPGDPVKSPDSRRAVRFPLAPVKGRIESRYRKYPCDPWRRRRQRQAAAGEVHGLHRHGEFAQPSRVDIRQAGQVDDDVKVPGPDQGADRVAQRRDFALVRADDAGGRSDRARVTVPERPKENVHDALINDGLAGSEQARPSSI